MRFMYKIAGLAALGLGILGAFLPLMPTTVFVLIAAGCFAKSSPGLHARLANSRVFGAVIRQWESRRCIPQKARYLATGSMLVAGSISFLVTDSLAFRLAIVAVIALSIASVMSVKVCPVMPRRMAGYQNATGRRR